MTYAFAHMHAAGQSSNPSMPQVYNSSPRPHPFLNTLGLISYRPWYGSPAHIRGILPLNMPPQTLSIQFIMHQRTATWKQAGTPACIRQAANPGGAPPSDSSLAEVGGARLQVAAVLGGYFYRVLGLRATQHPHHSLAMLQVLLATIPLAVPAIPFDNGPLKGINICEADLDTQPARRFALSTATLQSYRHVRGTKRDMRQGRNRGWHAWPRIMSQNSW